MSAVCHVVESGPPDAPLIVLVHGSMDRASGMQAAARRLETDFRVARYDRRGYGRSIALDPPFTIDQQVEDLLVVLAGRPATVFGHSFGGDVALTGAARHPDVVRAVGAYEPPMSWAPWWPEHTAGGDAVRRATDETPAAAAELFMRRMVGDRLWERLPTATQSERQAEGVALVGELADLRREAPYRADDITVPVLLAHGEHAGPHHLAGAKALEEAFGGEGREPPAELVKVPGAGHGIHRQDPQAFAELVRRLAARVTGP